MEKTTQALEALGPSPTDVRFLIIHLILSSFLILCCTTLIAHMKAFLDGGRSR